MINRWKPRGEGFDWGTERDQFSCYWGGPVRPARQRVYACPVSREAILLGYVVGGSHVPIITLPYLTLGAGHQTAAGAGPRSRTVQVSSKRVPYRSYVRYPFNPLPTLTLERGLGFTGP